MRGAARLSFPSILIAEIRTLATSIRKWNVVNHFCGSTDAKSRTSGY